MIDCEEFIRNMYPRPKFIRQRKNYEILCAFQEAIELIMKGCITENKFVNSLRYKRLFYLRKEYRHLIEDKLTYADMQ